MKHAQTTTPDRGPNPTKPVALKRWPLFLAFGLFVVTVMAGGHVVFQRYKDKIRRDTQEQLSGIAKLKTMQITNWMADRMSSAETFMNDPLFQSETARWLKLGSPPGSTRSKLLERMTLACESAASYGCTAITLYDRSAQPRLSTDSLAQQVHDIPLLLNSMASGEIQSSDLHEATQDNPQTLEIDFAAPLAAGKGPARHVIGAMRLRFDAHTFLFPLIQSWPTQSPSAESLLIRREGNEVVFLNELRHAGNKPLTLRLPLSNIDLPAAMAITGEAGTVEGLDYRGVPVVGVINDVPGTHWKMISKIDRAEIYAPINSLSRWIVLLMQIVILAGGTLVLFWRRQELRLLRAQQQQAEQEIEQQALRQRLDYLSKYANDAIMLVDANGVIVSVNDRAVEMYGYSAEEFSRMSIYDLRETKFASRISEDFQKIRETGSLRFESQHLRKTGEIFPAEVSVRAIEIDGQPFQQAIIRDITERKNAEAELMRQKEFFRQVIDSDPNLIFVKDDTGKFLLANKAMAESYGLTTETIIGKFNWEITHNLEQIAEFDRENREVIEKRHERESLHTTMLADGTTHVVHVLRRPLVQDDGTVNTLTIAVDVSELKQAQDDLIRLNRALKLLSDCNAAVVHIEQEEDLLTEICKLAVETGGYRMAWIGLIEHGALKTIHPAARYGDSGGYLDNVVINYSDTDHGRGPTGTAINTGETQINNDSRTSASMTPWREQALAQGFLANIALPLRSNQKIIGALTIYAAETNAFHSEEIRLLEELADNLSFGITALRTLAWRDQAAEKLRKSEELFRYLTENTSDVVFLMSMPSGHFDYISPAVRKVFGYLPEELYNTPAPQLIGQLVHPDSQALLEHLWEQALAGEVMPYIEYSITHRSGQRKWIGQRHTPVWNLEGGTLIAIQGVITDITERKLAEMQYHSEHQRLRTLIQTIPDMIWLKDGDGVYLSCNPHLARLFGASEAEIIGKTDYDFVDAELADHFRRKDREAMAAGKPSVNEEWVTYPDNGQQVLLETIKVPMWGNDGRLIGVMGIARDVTERINSAKAIRELNADLAATLKAIPDLMFEMGEDGTYLNIWAQNPALLAAQEHLLLGHTVNEMLPAEAAATIMCALAEAGEKGYSTGQIIKLALPHGDSWFELSTAIKTTDGTSKRRFIMLSRDITERKRVEEELKFSNTLLTTEHESSIDGILVVDESASKILSFNKRFMEIWDLPESLVESHDDKRVLETVLDKLVEPERFLEKVKHLYEHPQQTSRDEIMLRNGKVVDRYSAPMNGRDGNYYGRIWFFRDITERKQAEERESRLRHILDRTLDMIFIFRPDTLQFVYLNQGAIESTGYNNEQLLDMTPSDINPQMSEAEFRRLIAPLLHDEHRVLRFETVQRCQNGIDLPVEVQLQLVQETGGDNVFVAVVRDITERRQAERELNRQKDLLRQVIDTDPNWIVVKDARGIVLLVNQSMAEAHSLAPDEMIGRKLAELPLSPETVAAYLQDDDSIIEDGDETSQLGEVTLPSGKRGWLLTVKKRLTMPNGKLGVLSISADITRQKESEIELAKSYKELQRLSLHLETIRADERAKIAHNLHDEMGATLAALKMRISWLATKLPADPPLLVDEAAQIKELVSGGIQTMRRIVTELRPNLLDDVGLRAAMIDYVRKFRQHTHIECFLDLPRDEIVLNPNQSQTIFRILQESLNNIAKHAQATRVDITLSEQHDALTMVVRDNGVGFEPSQHKEHSFGLIGIRERALMVGGKARISSKPGRGTRISVTIPPA